MYSIDKTSFLSPTRLLGLVLGATMIAGCSGGGGSGANGDERSVVNIPGASADTPQEPKPEPEPAPNLLAVKVGTDVNTIASPLLSLNPGGPGGSPNQSLRAGDVLQGDEGDDLLIGGLGIDVLLGNGGDDVLIGGTEDFNSSVDGDNRGSDNRDRAFGGEGNDVFIWAPGDGSDFFDGGPGADTIVFGVLGEQRDADGSTDGAPFFNVNPPNVDGSQDFDGIFLQPGSNLPIARVSASPGFCTVLDGSTNPDELADLKLDQVVRFSLRGFAKAFDAGEREDDDGLRVAISLRNTEYLICTRRHIVAGAGDDNIQVLDLRVSPPLEIALADLPDEVRAQVE